MAMYIRKEIRMAHYGDIRAQAVELNPRNYKAISSWVKKSFKKPYTDTLLSLIIDWNKGLCGSGRNPYKDVYVVKDYGDHERFYIIDKENFLEYYSEVPPINSWRSAP